VIYGSPRGLTAAGNQFWTQDSPGILGVGESDTPTFIGDGFGEALGVANFGKGSQADLAVGVPGEDVGTIVDAGAVNVLYGSPSGLTAAGNQLWHQNSPASPGQLNASTASAGPPQDSSKNQNLVPEDKRPTPQSGQP
jgi:hypothetical protein